jgi:hypothetical protein
MPPSCHMPSPGRRRKQRSAIIGERHFVCGIPGSPGGHGCIYVVEIHTGHWRRCFGSPGPRQDDDTPLSCTGNNEAERSVTNARERSLPGFGTGITEASLQASGTELSVHL